MTINKHKSLVYRLYKDEGFKAYDRPLVLEDVVELERCYLYGDLYPRNGKWCCVKEFQYGQIDQEVRVYIELTEGRDIL